MKIFPSTDHQSVRCETSSRAFLSFPGSALYLYSQSQVLSLSTTLAGVPLSLADSYLVTKGDPICPLSISTRCWDPRQNSLQNLGTAKKSIITLSFTEDKSPTDQGQTVAQAQPDIQLFRYGLRETGSDGAFVINPT